MKSEPKAPSGLITVTNKSSQACVEPDDMLTEEQEIICTTENFLEYCDELAEKLKCKNHSMFRSKRIGVKLTNNRNKYIAREEKLQRMVYTIGVLFDRKYHYRR